MLEKVPSARFSAFKHSNLRERQKWMDINSSSLLFTEKTGYNLVESISRKLKCSPEHAINVYLPEVTTFLVMKQEGFNRVLAEIFLYDRMMTNCQ